MQTNGFAIIFEYLIYLLTSDTKHNIHSPFIYDFVVNVLNKRINYKENENIEHVRQQMLNSKAIIEVTDFGKDIESKYSKPLSKIVENASKKRKYASLLQRMIAYYHPQNILELGTNVGISTMYMMQALDINSKLITLEGCPNIASIAKYNIEKFENSSQVEIINGEFNENLSNVLSAMNRVDFVFIDGHHRFEPTIKYFETILPYCTNETIIIFDDINWSSEMRQAWHTISQHHRVSSTIDIFFMGIVFLRNELAKQNFKIRY